MISSALIDRIVYAKYLFHQGCENIERALPITDGIAILNFQDAAEMLLRTIAEYVNASIKESSTFSDIIQKIEEAPNNHQKSKIPFRTALN